MKLKTFQGKTMATALAEVKKRFGRDAIILNTRTLTKGGLLGFGGQQLVEITAAPSDTDLPLPYLRGRVEKRSGEARRAEGVAVPTSGRANPATSHLPDGLASEIGALKRLVHDLVRQQRGSQTADVPSELYDTYLKLIEHEVAEKIAEQLVQRVRNALPSDKLGTASAVRCELAKALKGMLPVSGPVRVAPAGEPTIIALVGPTGVGKTTTVAKLAANFCLRDRRKVGLITIDTYRIAAVEQLRTYAQIINVPLEVAMTPPELRAAVARMRDRDVILIDTAGRSQRDTEKINELKSFFSLVRPHEVHLVLSGTSGEAVLNEAIGRFSEVGIDRVIFTKIDETIGFGVMLNCLHKAGAALSYLTTGQGVPDDIEVGGEGLLADLLLGRIDKSASPAAGPN